MFEITRNDHEALEFYVNERLAYPGAEYDFTFENRYLVYHAPLLHKTVYLALDMKTKLSSEICRRDTGTYDESQYRVMMPDVLSAIKYTGDRRFLNIVVQNPMEVIDMIFRELLPMSGYAIREEQIALCKQMYVGLTQKQVAICEAEVGTGKSMAYLVAGFCARQQKKTQYFYKAPVTISTSSIELQNALIQKEIPMLSAILMKYRLIKQPLTAVLRKGKEHYFCMARYRDYIHNLEKYPDKHQRILNYLKEDRFAAKTFDLDKLQVPTHLKSRICVKGSCNNCPMQAQCRYYSFVSHALDERMDIDFQVTNHNLYILSATQPHLLRPSGMTIIDEAHKFRGAAETVYGDVINEKDMIRYVNYNQHMCSSKQNLHVFRKKCKGLIATYENLFSYIHSIANSDGLEDGGIGSVFQLTNNMQSLIKTVSDTILEIEAMISPVGKREISGLRLSKTLQQFLIPGEISVWIEEAENGELSLCSCPRDITKRMYSCIWHQKTSHVLTSGTMSDGSSFGFFRRENGLIKIKEDKLIESTTSSPFNYRSHTRLYIPDDLPIPDNDNKEYVAAIGKRIVELIHATNGHTAILFTSYKALNLVYSNISDQLQEYEVICMTKSNKTAIADFKKSKNGVLFASGSMWEGVDCAGDCLSSVIIVRLPFPMRSAGMEEKRNECGSIADFISTYAVPEMIIKLRQGAGRLIRSETDTGCLSILDSRASHSGAYRKRVLRALDKYPLVDSIDGIEEFFHTVKPEEYYK